MAEKIEQYGQEHQFIFGFEESYGFLAGTFVRDKDAVIASLLLCQAAAKAKAEGKTLLDELDLLLKTYGYHAERVKSYTLQRHARERKESRKSCALCVNSLRSR